MISHYLLAISVIGVCASRPIPPETVALPFSVGEKLTYEVSMARGGKVGSATMWIEGPVDIRGTSTYLLRFDSKVRIALLSAVSRSVWRAAHSSCGSQFGRPSISGAQN